METETLRPVAHGASGLPPSSCSPDEGCGRLSLASGGRLSGHRGGYDTCQTFLSKMADCVGGYGPAPKLLSVSCANCAKRQEAPQKKLLSEKKLFSAVERSGHTWLLAARPAVPATNGSVGEPPLTPCSRRRRHPLCEALLATRVSFLLTSPLLIPSRPFFRAPILDGHGLTGRAFSAVDNQVTSLAAVLSRYQGSHGEDGGSKNCFGRNGASIYIRVPLGTLVKEGRETVADLAHPGDEYMAALGGAGGKGNRFFLANDNRAPVTCTPGQPGQQRVLFLELKTVAHAGMIGFPNAGKSSLLRAISNARPAVAPYPFTTLKPHVGVVHYEGHQQVTVADIPGIVQGAHQNRGLGLAFLRHIQRCGFLLFVLDLSLPEPWAQLSLLKRELEQYQPGLAERPHTVVGNKIDLPEARARLPELQARLRPTTVIPLSATTGENLEVLLLRLKELRDDCKGAGMQVAEGPVSCSALTGQGHR
ncbi:mitochondrial ribosome-associated GTPase 2 [Echinops telfairi]|uniref:Mitochondrial ribosome-associated GTPase 2 n=1 Tax=Echinops telfairi TaxID=9371 RepID=A0AC55DM90_ECHTE|nr:mitochondrial ribosome-associated GTPase 2 [Echinops telfairi]